ncbi:MAG TPA: DUF1015 domain-containing protein [Terriglobales bacterium]|nr:DUF1015 domain-containing protein [Terriglobales bacterium]
MAEISPFRALRYDPAAAPLAELLTQPYDKITPQMQERYYASSPYNFVRLVLGKRQEGDDETSNAYTRAADSYCEWRRQGILRADPEPAFYAYSQRFPMPGANGERERTGFIALVQLEDYQSGVICRHERTLSAPKADRLKLLQATAAQFEPLFLLYSDPQRELEPRLNTERPPEAEVRDEYGALHRLSKVSNREEIEFIRDKMAEKKLLIADGHHRYETALEYRNLMRQRAGGAASDAASERVMVALFPMESEGLVILPTHRVVSGLENFHAEELVRGAQEYFEVNAAGTQMEARQVVALLQAAGKEGPALAAVTSGGVFLLRARAGAADRLLGDVSPRQRGLDVVLLHRILLEHVLGVSEKAVREERHLAYLRDAAEAMARVQAGANVGFLMNPARIEQVRDVAFAGEVLPQKSTDFYPKLLSGLTIYAH